MRTQKSTIQAPSYKDVRLQGFISQVPQNILVVSDLHLSEGYSPKTFRWHRRENFTFDEAFAAFLQSKSDAANCENSRSWLIINGDFIDFLRVTSTPRSEDDLEAWRHTLESITSAKLSDHKERILSGFHAFAIRWRQYVFDGSIPKARWPRDIRDELRYGLKTDDFKSIYRLMLVRNGHRRVFQALAEWLAAGHRLTIITGNHDQEFNQELVQAGFLWMLEELLSEEYGAAEAVVAQAQLVADETFADDAVAAEVIGDGWKVNGQKRRTNGHRVADDLQSPEPWQDGGKAAVSFSPDVARALSFEPRGLEIDDTIRVEHGHRFEWITWPGEEQVMSEHQELTLAPGSLFNRYLINHVEIEIPYLDNVKPVTRVISYLAKNHPLRFLGMLGQVITTFFRLAAKRGPGRLVFAALQKVAQFGLLAIYLVWIMLTALFHLLADNLERAQTFFEYAYFPKPLVEWLLSIINTYGGNLWQHIWAGPQLLDVHAPLYIVMAFFGLWFLISHFYYKSRPLHFSQAALKRKMSEGFALKNDGETRYAICGHTHDAQMQRWERGILHINSGCWTPVFQYEDGQVQDDQTMTFIEFMNNGDGWSSTLARWDGCSVRETDLISRETREQNKASRRLPDREILPAPGHKYTFDELTTLSKKQMDALMRVGGTPMIEDVLGFEYRGFNMNAGTIILGTRKFKKGFFGDIYTGHAWGYNVLVEQNKMSEPWLAKPNEQNPGRRYFFKLLPAGSGYEARYDHALFVDYARSGEYFVLHPARFTVDYLVYPDPQNHYLMLGKSDAVIGPIRLPLGYFILERHNASNYDRTSHFFSEREMRTLEKFGEVFIEGKNEALTPQQVAWNVDKHVERIKSNRTHSVKIVLFLLEYVLPLLAGHLPFSRMSEKLRRHFIESTLMNSHDGTGRGGMRESWLRVFNALREKILRDLSRIRLLFVAGYYGDRRVYDSIGFTEVRQRGKYDNDRAKVGVSRIDLYAPKANVVKTQICVIGSGAGGAVVAYNAAAAGKDVILLEDGTFTRSADMTHDEGEMMARLFKEGGLQSTIDLDMNLLQGKTLGGSTVINNAICFRLNDQNLSTGEDHKVLETWRELGAHIDENSLLQAYSRVEEMIRVRRIHQGIAGENANVLLSGWENLRRAGRIDHGSKYGLFRANVHECIGCGYCITGCPYGRKLSMAETYIPQAVRKGARVITECHVVGINMKGTQAVGVRAELRNGRRLLILAEQIVVSCGAIGSSVLLMKSGFVENVGKRFSCNASTPMLARFSKEINGFDGVQMPAYVDAGEFMLESWFAPPLSFAVTMPGWFSRHFERMKDCKRFASAGVLIGTEPNGRVKGTSLFRNLFGPIDYAMTQSDLKKLKRGMARLAQVYFAAGAETVYPASFVDLEMSVNDFRANRDIETFIDENIRKPDDLTLSSAHPQGGNAMSDDRKIGVVDSGFKVHGTDNLFVCDASVFPTSIGINPQLTIMAMADYAARNFIL